MKKLNNKGFAIASILYSIMVLFLLLLLSILGILGNRKAILDKNKKDILEELNKEVLYNKINFEHKNITIINRGNLDDIRFALLDGVSATDENGNEIGLDKINYNLDLNNIENKSYNVTYTVDRGNKIITATRQITFVPDSSDYIDNFDYTGDSQTFITKYDGSYRVELWGSSGGGYNSTGGKGAYTSGNINLRKNDNLFLYVGSAGNYTNDYQVTVGSYNGGATVFGQNGWPTRYFGSGGGATDLRFVNGQWDNFDSLKSRIMVAAAGGGSFVATDNSIIDEGGFGGTIVGGDGETTILGWGSQGYGASQTYGGYSICDDETCKYNDVIEKKRYQTGFFGYTFSTVDRNTSGGGSGYYGGGSSIHVQSSGGGSSFISGYDGCDAISEESTEDNIIHTGQSIHYSGYKFKNAVMYAGNEEMPTHDGNSTMVGNSGNGYAKISLIYYY